MSEYFKKQSDAFNKAAEERGEDDLSYIMEDGIIIPIIKSTGKIVGNVVSVEVKTHVDDFGKMKIEVYANHPPIIHRVPNKDNKQKEK